MTSANIPAPVRGQDADAPDLALDTGKEGGSFGPMVDPGRDRRRASLKPVCVCVGGAGAGLTDGPTQRVEGGPRVREGGGPIPGRETAAVAPGGRQPLMLIVQFLSP